MNPRRMRLLGWGLLIINLGYCGYALGTGVMEGLGELFGWFTRSPNMPTTLGRKPWAFLLGFASHAAMAYYGFTLIKRSASGAGVGLIFRCRTISSERKSALAIAA